MLTSTGDHRTKLPPTMMFSPNNAVVRGVSISTHETRKQNSPQTKI
jgi:hypothetical protein